MNARHSLIPGDPFPSLSIAVADRANVELPDALAGHYAVVLVFRGAWCPYCNAQLRAYERARDRLDQLDVRVVAVSADDEAATRALVDKHGLSFPVGHGADVDELQAALGAFSNEDGRYLQSTGFVLDPTGRVIVSVYSSGAIGRLMPDDAIGLIRYSSDDASAAA
jgi:peroxiredoxin